MCYILLQDSLISVWWSSNGGKTTATNDGAITVHKMLGTTEFNCQEGNKEGNIYYTRQQN